MKNKRKEYPVYSGFIKYFPDAILEVAHVSFVGNDQHNPGTPLHWDRAKSRDDKDAEVRHLIDHAKAENGNADFHDTDTLYHLAKNAWRAMAALQTFLEEQKCQK